MIVHIKTLSVRVRDKHAKLLNQWAFEVNQVWNAANALTAEFASVPIPEVGWVNLSTSVFDLQKELKTIRAEQGFSIGSTTLQETIAVHGNSRKQFKKNKLKWRVSGGSKRNLGWIPFKQGAAQWKNGCVKFNGLFLKVWDSYGLSQYDFRAGSFSEDSRGRWYFNVCVQVEAEPSGAISAIGVDLGLKATAACSDGTVFERKGRYRELEEKLGIAQRAKKKARVKAIHAKIKNRRKDDIHKFTTALVNNHGAIFVGDVSSTKLAKTKMAKSVLDAGWGMLKTQLKYKAIARSVVFEVVNEKYSTQICSCCGVISASSPKGRAGLGIREWACPDCGTQHDRDINAATNILALGYKRLAGGILAF
jgi:IS605 OrfB family transposase